MHATVLTLAILAAVIALPFHLMAEHADEAERGVCGVCIALSIYLAPSDRGIISEDADALATVMPLTRDACVESIVTTLEAPRGPPPILA